MCQRGRLQQINPVSRKIFIFRPDPEDCCLLDGVVVTSPDASDDTFFHGGTNNNHIILNTGVEQLVKILNKEFTIVLFAHIHFSNLQFYLKSLWCIVLSSV